MLIGAVVLQRRSEAIPCRPRSSSQTAPAATKYIGCSELPEFAAEMRKAVNSGRPAMAGERRITARWSTTMAASPMASPMPSVTPRVVGAGAA